jgi:molecular chaperone DnaK (HSP70)
MNRVRVVGIALIGFILLSGAAHAEIFKWVDANGKVHFSDRKISSQAQKVNVKTGGQNNVDSNNGQDNQTAEQRLLQQQKYVNFLTSERLERQEKRQEAQQEKDKKRKLCAAMQDQLKGYTHGNYRWYKLDEESGERQYLADDQIEAKKQELQTEIKSNCS